MACLRLAEIVEPQKSVNTTITQQYGKRCFLRAVPCRAEQHRALLHIVAVNKLSAVLPSNASVNTHSTQQWEYGVYYAVSATIVAGQWFSKHSVATIWEYVFSLWSVPRDYLEDNWSNPGSSWRQFPE
jgi:hypothetical protein